MTSRRRFQLGQPAGEVDARGADVVERKRGADPALCIVGHGHPREHAVEPEPPRVLHVAPQAEGPTVVGVEGPADARGLDPCADRLEVVVAEPEPAAHGPGGAEVEHPAGLGPSASDAEQAVDDGEQGVGLRKRPVGEPDLEPVAGMPLAPNSTSTAGTAEAEGRLDERCVGLDVGAHHQHVTRLERGIVGEQTEDHLPQHLDLAGVPVAGMHLHAAVGGVEGPLVRSGERVGFEVVLEPPEQGAWALGSGTDGVVDVDERHERALQLADVTTQRREERMVDALVRGVVAARQSAGQVDQRVPLGVGRVRQPDVHVAATPEGTEQLGFGDRNPGVAEQREPRRQALRSLALAQRSDDARVAFCRRRRVGGGEQVTPQLGLPAQVWSDLAAVAVLVVTVGPRGEQRGSLGGVRGEQSGETPGHGVAAAAAQLAFFALDAAAEVRVERGAPRFAGVGVEHVEHRPDEGVWRPWVLVADPGELGDERARRAEVDRRAHAIVAGLGSEVVRQALTQPTFDTASGHDDQLQCERVVLRCP